MQLNALPQSICSDNNVPRYRTKTYPTSNDWPHNNRCRSTKSSAACEHTDPHGQLGVRLKVDGITTDRRRYELAQPTTRRRHPSSTMGHECSVNTGEVTVAVLVEGTPASGWRGDVTCIEKAFDCKDFFRLKTGLHLKHGGNDINI